MTELEKRIVAAQKAGQAWAVADEKYFLLDETKKSVLADLINDLDDSNTSEAKLERLARSTKAWRGHIAALSIAKGEALRAKVRYESCIAWYEAERTKEASQRVSVARGLYQTGTGG